MINKPLSCFLLRLAVAMSMLTHGLVRIPKLEAFASGMAQNFQPSMLPQDLVLVFGYFLPIAELLIGILLLIGLFTKYATIGGALVMSMLIFGSGMIEQWGAMPSQLIHALFFVLLLSYNQYDKYSVDSLLVKNRL